jgi:hypothetical protein
MIENQMNIYGMVIRPNILEHRLSNKKYYVRNSLIVGQSSSFNCTRDVFDLTLSFNKSSVINSYGAGLSKRGKIGMIWSNFLSGSNQADKKPFTNIKTYNSLDGLTIVSNITFAHFDLGCNLNRDYVISNSLNNDDGQHPVSFRNVYLNNVQHASKVFLHRLDFVYLINNIKILI